MINGVLRYLKQQHVGLLALFIALGAGGAVAATSMGGGQVRGFSIASGNANSTRHGTAITLSGLTLKWQSVARPDERDCVLSASSNGRADIGYFSATHGTGEPQQSSVAGKSIGSHGSVVVARASFLPGAPNIVQQTEGQLTFHAGSSKDVVSAQYHVGSEKNRCLFQGTVSAGH
jgi:hypothetical protein